MSEKEITKSGLNEEFKIQAEQMRVEPFHVINERNPVVKAQKQISSQETAGVFSPQQE